MARLLRSACLKRALFCAEGCRQQISRSAFQIQNYSTKGKRKSKSDGSDSGEEKLSEKDLALQQALDQITSSFGKGAIMWLGRTHGHREVPVISTGSFALDLALGIGGLPKGRVVEIYGPEASGKTTLALHVIAEAQKNGADWWMRFGGKTPELQSFAIRVLSLTCSASGCERNWSTFEAIHTKKRNRLEHKRLSALVYVMYNTRLRERSIRRRQQNMDPILVEEIESDDEWIAEKEDPILPLEPRWLEDEQLFNVDAIRSISTNLLEGQSSSIPSAPTPTQATHKRKTLSYCAFVDAEHALDPTLAESIGVKTDNLLLSQPDSGEQALSLVDTLIRSGSVDVVVVDSVAALVPKSELDGEMGDAHMALQARLMSQALRKLCHSLSLSQTILVFVNQVRSKLSTFGGFGGPVEVTSGGNALKFYASVRLNIKRVGLVKKGEETVGSQVVVKIVKNKHAPPFKTAQFELEFGKGICRESEIIDIGLKHKFITKVGSFYRLNDRSFHGKEALKRYLVEEEGAREDLVMKLREKLIHTEVAKKDDPENEIPEDLPVEIVTSETTDEEVVSEIVS